MKPNGLHANLLRRAGKGFRVWRSTAKQSSLQASFCLCGRNAGAASPRRIAISRIFQWRRKIVDFCFPAAAVSFCFVSVPLFFSFWSRRFCVFFLSISNFVLSEVLALRFSCMLCRVKKCKKNEWSLCTTSLCPGSSP